MARIIYFVSPAIIDGFNQASMGPDRTNPYNPKIYPAEHREFAAGIRIAASSIKDARVLFGVADTMELPVELRIA